MSRLHILKNLKLSILCLSIFALGGANGVAASEVSYNEELEGVLDSIEQILRSDQFKTPQSKVAGVQTIVVNNDAELAKALISAIGGETIQLNPGTYGSLLLREDIYSQVSINSVILGKRTAKLTSQVIITSSDPGNRAVVKDIHTVASPYWRFEGLSLRPDSLKNAFYIESDYNVVTKNDISYGNVSNWTAADWNKIAGSIAMYIRSGKNVEVSYNQMKNISFGISIDFNAPDARVFRNVIDTFNGDGIRGLGDRGIFENNLIKNPLQTNDNHSDFFQSWRNYTNANRPVEGVVVRNNTFLAIGNHPLLANTQGVGLFDGPYKGWTVENNLIISSTYHGISLYGPVDSVVRKNVVIDPNNVIPGPTWVAMFATGLGEPPINSNISDNLATNYIIPASGVTASGNTKVTSADFEKYFVDYQNNDWTIKAGVLPYSVGVIHDASVVATPTPTPTPTPTTTTVTNSTTTTTVISTSTTVYLKVSTKVYRRPGSRLIGTQPASASGIYDATKSPILKNGISWVRVDFKTGKDGYVDKSTLSTTKPTMLQFASTTTMSDRGVLLVKIRSLLAKITELQVKLNQSK